MQSGGIVFFDGECSFCNKSVSLIYYRDKKKQFSFSPLDSLFAANNLPSELTIDPDSLVIIDNSQNILVKAHAIKYLASTLDLTFFTQKLILSTPNCCINFIYYFISKYRKCISKIFFRHCELPPPEFSRRILEETKNNQ